MADRDGAFLVYASAQGSPVPPEASEGRNAPAQGGLVLPEASQGQGALEAATVAPEGEAPAAIPAPWLWAGIALGVAAAAAVILLIVRARGRKRRRAASAALTGCPVAVGKVHEQGKRPEQQDSFSVSSPDIYPTHGLLAVVADGMGGLSDGDRVSQAAVSTMSERFYSLQGEPEHILLALLEEANRAVNALLGPSGLTRSGSTLAAGLIRDDRFCFVSVGDSRVCLYRDGVLRQLNREHIHRSALYLRAVNGEMSLQAAVSDPKGSGLTSFLGMGRLAAVDMPARPERVLPGDKFILMSDGVYNALSEQELCAALDLEPAGAAEALRRAIAGKGYPDQDNYTAVILERLG